MNLYVIAVIQGIVEGITEFLPVSSTGHLILSGYLLGFTDEKAKSFEIFIQLGAILAVVVLYKERIMALLGMGKPVLPGEEGTGAKNTLSIWHIGLAMIPAVVGGLLLRKTIKAYLFSPATVLVGLVVGGIFLILAEKKTTVVSAATLDQISFKQALSVGFFQCLALWPGFSRSGATIAGGLLCGLTHKAAADFSFLVAVPMMIAASGLDLVKSYKELAVSDIGFFGVGFLVSFVVAILAIKFFLAFLERWKLSPFAWYRFAVAGLYYWLVLR